MYGVRKLNMNKIIIRKKRLSTIVALIFLVFVAEPFCIIEVVFFPNLFVKLLYLLFSLILIAVIYSFVDDFFTTVIISNEKICIRYGIKIKSDEIRFCEYESNKIISGNKKVDIIILRYDQHHFISINSLEYENFDELLRYIVDKKIKVKTDNPKEFVKAQNRIVYHPKSSGEYISESDDERKELSIREKILVVISTCAYLCFGCYVMFLAISEKEVSYKTIITFTVGLLIAIVGCACPTLFSRKK